MLRLCDAMKTPHLVSISSQKVIRLGLCVIATLVALNVAAYTMRLSGDLPGARFMMVYFSLDREANFPTYFSVVQLVVAGLLCLSIARNPSHQGERRSWQILGYGMLFMSIDEMTQIHELG